MKRYLFGVIVVTILSISGCGDKPSETASEKIATQKRGEARVAAFDKCMELAAKMPRQSDDDVSDIVEECTTTSYYLTNFIN